MRQPTKPKPQAFEEVARVLNIARMLDEELRAITGPPKGFTLGPDSTTIGPSFDILAVAERIAARTEG